MAAGWPVRSSFGRKRLRRAGVIAGGAAVVAHHVEVRETIARIGRATAAGFIEAATCEGQPAAGWITTYAMNDL